MRSPPSNQLFRLLPHSTSPPVHCGGGVRRRTRPVNNTPANVKRRGPSETSSASQPADSASPGWRRVCVQYRFVLLVYCGALCCLFCHRRTDSAYTVHFLSASNQEERVHLRLCHSLFARHPPPRPMSFPGPRARLRWPLSNGRRERSSEAPHCCPDSLP